MFRKMSVQKRNGIRIIGVLLTVVWILCMSIGLASASEENRMPDIDPHAKGTLKVTLAYREGSDADAARIPVAGASIEIYQVAELQVAGGSAQYVLKEPYHETGIVFADMTADESGKAAAELASLKGAAPTASVLTDQNGQAVFSDLEQGMYLVMENKAAGTADATEAIAPYLVMVPYPQRNAEGNSWNMAVESEPKVPLKKTGSGSGSIRVTKALYTADEVPIGLYEGSFFVALFDTEQLTKRVSEVQKITFAGQQSSETVFSNLETGRAYYLAETDESGAPVSSSVTLSDNIYVPVYPNGQQVQLEVQPQDGAVPEGKILFHNVFYELPKQYYYSGKLTITKKVVKGSQSMKSDETFYAAIFTDPEFKDRYGDVIELKMNGKSEYSVPVDVSISTDLNGSATYYVTETDKSGNPLDNAKLSEYQFSVSNDGKVTMTVNENASEVVITNTYPEKPTNPTNPTNPSNPSSPGSPSNSSTTPKTGDQTPLMLLIVLLVVSAAVCVLLVGRKRRRQ